MFEELILSLSDTKYINAAVENKKYVNPRAKPILQ